MLRLMIQKDNSSRPVNRNNEEGAEADDNGEIEHSIPCDPLHQLSANCVSKDHQPKNDDNKPNQRNSGMTNEAIGDVFNAGMNRFKLWQIDRRLDG